MLLNSSLGIKTKLLWQNPTYTATFASQTLSIDCSNYDYFIVFSAFYYTNQSSEGLGQAWNSMRHHSLVCKNKPQYIGSGGMGDTRVSRYVSIKDSSIYFGSGYVSKNAGTGENTQADYYCIPLEVYGITGMTIES